MTIARVACLMMLMFMVAGRANAQVPADLQKAMAERDQAITKADASTWDRLTADDFTLVDQTGSFMNKTQRLAQLKTQKPAPAPAPQRVQIKGYGDAYVRRFLSGDIWVLDVWVRQPAGWRVAAVQVTTAKK
jgi:uncharacterized protein DUF4440